MTDLQTPPFDPTPTYSRAYLESILGQPDTVHNFGNGVWRPIAGGSPWEEPIPGMPLFLGWVCQRPDEFGCTAIALPRRPNRFVITKHCAQHDIFDPYRTRVVTVDDRRRRATWIKSFWQELTVLDGVVREGNSARCRELRLVLDDCDLSDPRKIDVADFCSEQPSISVGLSILTCGPRRAALALIGTIFRGAQVDVEVAGAPEPVRIVLESDIGDTALNGSTTNGERLSLDHNLIERIKLV